jgi:hypothetical protein
VLYKNCPPFLNSDDPLPIVSIMKQKTKD